MTGHFTLVAFQGCKLNITVKSPNWPDAYQLAIYKCDQGGGETWGHQ